MLRQSQKRLWLNLGLMLKKKSHLGQKKEKSLSSRKDKYTYKITEDGLLYKSPTFTNWSISSLGTIGKLLDGDVKAVPKLWKPKKGEKYWTYSEIWEEVTSFRWEGYYYDLLLWKVGNCFKTKDKAEDKGKEIMEQIQKEYEEN